MSVPVCGLKISGSTTAQSAPATAAAYTTGWAALGLSQHGELSGVASAANSRLTLKPGLYRCEFSASVEADTGAGPTGEQAEFTIRRGGSAIADDKPGRADFQGIDRPVDVQAVALVEITPAHVTASTNYVQVYIAADTSPAIDTMVRDALFVAYRLDT